MWKRGITRRLQPKRETRTRRLGFGAALGGIHTLPQSKGVSACGNGFFSSPQHGPGFGFFVFGGFFVFWIFLCFLQLSDPNKNTRLLQGRGTAESRPWGWFDLTVVPFPARSSVTKAEGGFEGSSFTTVECVHLIDSASGAPPLP